MRRRSNRLFFSIKSNEENTITKNMMTGNRSKNFNNGNNTTLILPSFKKNKENITKTGNISIR